MGKIKSRSRVLQFTVTSTTRGRHQERDYKACKQCNCRLSCLGHSLPSTWSGMRPTAAARRRPHPCSPCHTPPVLRRAHHSTKAQRMKTKPTRSLGSFSSRGESHVKKWSEATSHFLRTSRTYLGPNKRKNNFSHPQLQFQGTVTVSQQEQKD